MLARAAATYDKLPKKKQRKGNYTALTASHNNSSPPTPRWVPELRRAK